ncbi:MAG: hypothetical protein ACREQP_19915 [Candidatus Binatia bacterium]
MSAAKSQWTIILRCYSCSRKFTVRHLTLDRVLAVASITPCPHCSTKPFIAPGPLYNKKSTLHRIFDLREETETIYRRPRNGDTWHFNPRCSKWPVDDYVELEAAPNTGELCNECQATPRDHP